MARGVGNFKEDISEKDVENIKYLLIPGNIEREQKRIEKAYNLRNTDSEYWSYWQSVMEHIKGEPSVRKIQAYQQRKEDGDSKAMAAPPTPPIPMPIRRLSF